MNKGRTVKVMDKPVSLPVVCVRCGAVSMTCTDAVMHIVKGECK